jgi:broad specificity phosphatase PhoE
VEGLPPDPAARVGPERARRGPGAGLSRRGRHRVVLWRHGVTRWNLEGRFQGQLDSPLADDGHSQARAAAAILARLTPDAIVSSDLSRAALTAAELAAVTGLDVSYDAGLREIYLGSWQGLNRAEVAERHPGELAAWKRGEIERRGGGESNAEVAGRVAAVIERSLEKLPGPGTLVAVTHGYAARVAIGHLIGLPPQYWGVLGALSNCCWSVLGRPVDYGDPGPGRSANGWVLLEHNAGTLPQPVLRDDR